jgi:dihydroxyacetone kinase-like protein
MSGHGADALSADELRGMMLAVAGDVVANEAMLCEADRHVGDGDHGLGMARGFAAAAERLAALEPSGIEDVLSAVSRALIATMGGASGVIFGLLFRPAAGMSGPSVDVAQLAAHFDGALQQISARGGARVGDKTMLDALAPAVAALRAGRALTMAEALGRAAQAAQEGAERSAAFVARRGKAAPLGERAQGFSDPGAVSTALIFRTMAAWAAEAMPVTTVAGSSKEEAP